MDHQRTRAYYERSARSYDASVRTVERMFLGDSRSWAASLAEGDVLEVGIGTGRNLAYYPPGVRLTGVDVSPAMLAFARDRARELQLQIDLREVTAESLPFADASFDTVVCTIALCSVADDRLALQQMARVLRPGGRAILVEHVRSPVWPVRLIQMVLDPLSVRFEVDHLMRDPLDYLPSADLQVEFCERSKWGIIERLVLRKTPSLT